MSDVVKPWQVIAVIAIHIRRADACKKNKKCQDERKVYELQLTPKVFVVNKTYRDTTQHQRVGEIVWSHDYTNLPRRPRSPSYIARNIIVMLSKRFFENH